MVNLMDKETKHIKYLKKDSHSDTQSMTIQRWHILLFFFASRGSSRWTILLSPLRWPHNERKAWGPSTYPRYPMQSMSKLYIMNDTTCQTACFHRNTDFPFWNWKLVWAKHQHVSTDPINCITCVHSIKFRYKWKLTFEIAMHCGSKTNQYGGWYGKISEIGFVYHHVFACECAVSRW